VAGPSSDFGFGVWGLGVSRFRVESLWGVLTHGSGFGVRGSGFGVRGSGFRVPCQSSLWSLVLTHGSWFRVPGSGFLANLVFGV